MDSGMHAKTNEPGLFSTFLSFLMMVAIVFVAAFLLRLFVIAPYQIPSGSMETTIMISDKLFSEKVSYYMRGPKPGEIVTFKDPEVEGRTLIKRCIAVAGQEVDLRNGELYVDGQRMSEPYTNGLPSNPLATAPGVELEYPFTVPEGTIWVMGDNRTNSSDSRYFGPISIDAVTGHACFIYWPLNRVGPLD